MLQTTAFPLRNKTKKNNAFLLRDQEKGICSKSDENLSSLIHTFFKP